MTIFCHLVCSPSMYNGFDEDPQVLSRLPGLVSFETNAKPCRAAVIKWHLKHKLLLSILRNKGWQTGHLILLGVGETVMGSRCGERQVDEDKKRQSTTHWSWMVSKSETKSSSIWETPSGEAFHLNLSKKIAARVYYWREEIVKKKITIHLDCFHTRAPPPTHTFFFQLKHINKTTPTFQEVIGEYGKQGVPGTQK